MTKNEENIKQHITYVFLLYPSLSKACSLQCMCNKPIYAYGHVTTCLCVKMFRVPFKDAAAANCRLPHPFFTIARKQKRRCIGKAASLH